MGLPSSVNPGYKHPQRHGPTFVFRGMLAPVRLTVSTNPLTTCTGLYFPLFVPFRALTFSRNCPLPVMYTGTILTVIGRQVCQQPLDAEPFHNDGGKEARMRGPLHAHTLTQLKALTSAWGTADRCSVSGSCVMKALWALRTGVGIQEEVSIQPEVLFSELCISHIGRDS